VEVSYLSVAGSVNPQYIVGFENLVEFTDLQNNMLVGDEIRLEPVTIPPIDFAPAPKTALRSTPHAPRTTPSAAPDIDSFDTLTILAAGISSFTITGEQLSMLPSHVDFVLSADKKIDFDHHELVEGNVRSNRDIEFDNGRPSTLDGNVTAVRNVEIARDNTVTGTVEAGGTVKVDPEATTGTVTEGASVAALPLPALSFGPFTGPDFVVDKDEEGTAGPGDYDRLRGMKDAVIHLTSGTYNLNRLVMDAEAKLKIDLSSGGPILIHVFDRLLFRKNSEIIVQGGSSDEVWISYRGTKAAVFDKDGKYQGTVAAPNARVILGSDSRFLGAIIAKRIEVHKDVRARHHGLGGLPKAAPVADEAASSEQSTVTSYQLEQNYPNPFPENRSFGKPSTVISFQLPVASEVRLAIYNLAGQLVRELAKGQMAKGKHSVIWDARDASGTRVASGVYVYRLQAGEFVAVRKMVLMR